MDGAVREPDRPSRSPSTTTATSPGSTTTPAVASRRVSSAVSSASVTVCRNSVTSFDHWETISAWWTLIGVVASTPKDVSRTSQPWQWQCSTSPPEALGDPCDRRELVGQPGGEDQPPRVHGPSGRERHAELAVVLAGHVHRPVPDQLDAVPRDLLAPRGEEFRGRHAVPGQIALQMRGGRVARLARVDD